MEKVVWSRIGLNSYVTNAIWLSTSKGRTHNVVLDVFLKADFLTLQKPLPDIFFSKEISQVILTAMVLVPNFYF